MPPNDKMDVVEAVEEVEKSDDCGVDKDLVTVFNVPFRTEVTAEYEEPTGKVPSSAT